MYIDNDWIYFHWRIGAWKLGEFSERYGLTGHLRQPFTLNGNVCDETFWDRAWRVNDKEEVLNLREGRF